MIKRCLLIFVGLLTAAQGFSQNTFTNTGTNVGIGTTMPKALLQVNGTFLSAGGEANVDGTNPGYSQGQLNFLANSGYMLIGWNRSAGAGEASFISNQGPGWGGGFAFYNHANSNVETQLMYIRADGTVGIGTDDTKGYKLAVNGSIIGTQVVVKSYGNWPDYVFKPAYRLPSLSSIASYTARNQHLPDMPSATVVEKEGLNLGEMNRLLVKKVEELTLYLIDEHEKNQKQQGQIEQLSRTLQIHSSRKSKKH